MRVLIFSQYFTPEVLAPPARLHPIAATLARAGHEVEVVCEVPNYPDGIVKPEYRGRPVLRREIDGFKVSYVWVKTSPVKTTKSRLLLYATYALSSTLAGAISRRPDVVFASSPPLPVAAAGAAVAWRHRVPWVIDVRDPWPEAAVALGELTNPRVIDYAERLERRLYASAAAIVTVTEPFRQGIAAKVADPGKICVVPNGTTQLWLDAAKLEVDRGDLGMPADRFVCTYAGNIGLAQGIGAAIDGAALLDDGFQLQIIGDGPLLAEMKERAAKLPAGRVAFRGLMPPAEAARYLRASDANLVPLMASPEFEQFVPSKLFDCCAVGRPTVVSAAGESQRLAKAADAALAIPPEDPEALAGALRQLQADPELCKRLGSAGTTFAAGYLRERQVERLDGVLRAVVAGAPIDPGA